MCEQESLSAFLHNMLEDVETSRQGMGLMEARDRAAELEAEVAKLKGELAVYRQALEIACTGTVDDCLVRARADIVLREHYEAQRLRRSEEAAEDV